MPIAASFMITLRAIQRAKEGGLGGTMPQTRFLGEASATRVSRIAEWRESAPSLNAQGKVAKTEWPTVLVQRQRTFFSPSFSSGKPSWHRRI